MKQWPQAWTSLIFCGPPWKLGNINLFKYFYVQTSKLIKIGAGQTTTGLMDVVKRKSIREQRVSNSNLMECMRTHESPNCNEIDTCSIHRAAYTKMTVWYKERKTPPHNVVISRTKKLNCLCINRTRCKIYIVHLDHVKHPNFSQLVKPVNILLMA